MKPLNWKLLSSDSGFPRQAIWRKIPPGDCGSPSRAAAGSNCRRNSGSGRSPTHPSGRRPTREGLRWRSAYKLIEIDDRCHFLKRGITVVDLGAAPGGGSQIAAKRVGAPDGKGKAIPTDLLEMPETAGVPS